MVKIKGIDVSHWQNDIDWEKVKADGVQFVFVKATQGTKYVDDKFLSNVKGAVGAGLHVGAYHFATFDTVAEAKAEAKYFLSNVKGLHLDYPLVLDLEQDKANVSNSQLTDAAVAFLEELESAGYFAMLYTGKSFLESQLDEKRLKPYSIWVARYNDTLGRDADVWQYTSSGKVNGIKGNVDMNWSYRDFALEIKQMKNSAHVAPPKPKYHTVIKGDNATKICKKYSVTLSQLDKLNPSVKDWDLIYPNQKLRIK
jgi:lysozyme